MKPFGGRPLFLDRSDINTDEIIPAKYLTELLKSSLKPHLLEDFQHQGFNKALDLHDVQVIITRANFGCGSSREHAVWALEVNGITAVVAAGFARIFRQNMFNCGLVAIELPHEEIDALFALQDRECSCMIEISTNSLVVQSKKGKKTVSFSLTDYERSLIQSGGWFEFADARYFR